MTGYKRLFSGFAFAAAAAFGMSHVEAPPTPKPKAHRPLKVRNGNTIGYAKPDKRTRRFKHGQYGHGGAPSSQSRRELIDAHNRNALNFLPGFAVRNIMVMRDAKGHSLKQSAMEREAHGHLLRMIQRGYRPKPGFNFAHWERLD